MKMKICGLLMSIVFMACSQGNSQNKASIPAPVANEKTATFAGGCFWAMQECMSELKGVRKVVSGYAGGTTVNPTYKQVSARNTGHAESVQVYYDPKVISFGQLTEAFFYAHDPTQLNRQGPDIGDDYRSIAFYRTPGEKEIIGKVIAKVKAGKHYSDKIVTQVVPLKVIYPAEAYHQNYYKLNQGNSYIENVSKPKVMKLRKAMPNLIKPEFL